MSKIDVYVKQSHNTPMEAQGETMYSSQLFSNSALGGGKWSASRPGCALPTVPVVQEAGWAPVPVWTQRLQEKSFACAEDRTSIAQSSSL
jgi:hypothetical protein